MRPARLLHKLDLAVDHAELKQNAYNQMFKAKYLNSKIGHFCKSCIRFSYYRQRTRPSRSSPRLKSSTFRRTLRQRKNAQVAKLANDVVCTLGLWQRQALINE